MDGLRYVVSEEAAAVIEKIQALPQSGDYDLEAVIEAYRQYAALTDSQKAEVVNDADLEALTNRVGADNHMDTATGLKGDGLAWYIRLSVREVTQTEEAYTRLSESVGSNTLVQMLEITLTDILTGETYQPSGEITFLLPSPDMSGFDSVAVAQYTDDGQVAYLSCEIKDGEIERCV